VVVSSAAIMPGEETEGGVEEGAGFVGEEGVEDERCGRCHGWPCAYYTDRHHEGLRDTKPNTGTRFGLQMVCNNVFPLGVTPRHV